MWICALCMLLLLLLPLRFVSRRVLIPVRSMYGRMGLVGEGVYMYVCVPGCNRGSAEYLPYLMKFAIISISFAL